MCVSIQKYYGKCHEENRHKWKEIATLGVSPSHNHNIQAFLKQQQLALSAISCPWEKNLGFAAENICIQWMEKK